MKSASSLPVAGSRAAGASGPFPESSAPGRIVPDLRRKAGQTGPEPALDPGFPREPRGSGESVLDYSALLMQERETHSAALADRDRLLAIFSHDLKNLLNALTLNATIALRRNGEPAEKGASNVRVILGRMDRMLSNLLDLARVNAGKLRVVAQSGDAAEVVREAVDAFRPLAEEKHLTLRFSETGGPFGARVDHDRIFQVLSNLISNAIKFSFPEGKIFVSLSKIDHFVRVAVRDFGHGIEEADFERIFECYRQLDGSDGTGLGLGLFISKSIIQAHGGQIWAESKLGAGSTFFFTVPGINGAPRAEAPPALLGAAEP
jgi:signal transduction histidine kinase